MRIEVYADALFFINFFMDTIIFWIVSKLIRRTIKFKRILIGSFVMAILYCFLILKLNSFYNIFGTFAILLIGIMLTFVPVNVFELLKLLCLIHISAFIVGGMSMAVFYCTNLSEILQNISGFRIENFSFKLLFFSTISTYIFIKVFFKRLRKFFVKQQVFYQVDVYFNNAKANFNALLDTGNSLCDPFCKQPVMIVELEAIKNFFSDDFRLAFYENKNNLDVLLNSVKNSALKKKLRLIPFKSIGSQNGLLIGFVPDCVKIHLKNKICIADKIIIGICEFNLSNDFSYNALIGPNAFLDEN